MINPMPGSTLYFQTVCERNPLKNKSNLAEADKTDIITSAFENQEESYTRSAMQGVRSGPHRRGHQPPLPKGY
jgi:hypothetical protein